MMVSRLFSVALASAIPLVSALTISVPSNLTSAGPAVISWTAVAGDPQSFSIFLTNAAFHNSFGIANNVPTGAMTISLTLPVVPVGDGYTIEFTNVGNQSDVFAETGTFPIGATVSTSASSTSTSSIPATAPTVSPTGTTAPGSSTSTTPGSSSTGSSTGTGTSSAASNSATVFNNAAFKAGFSETGLAGSALLLALGMLGF